MAGGGQENSVRFDSLGEPGDKIKINRFNVNQDPSPLLNDLPQGNASFPASG
jgi:hypothetical protein